MREDYIELDEVKIIDILNEVDEGVSEDDIDKEDDGEEGSFSEVVLEYVM